MGFFDFIKQFISSGKKNTQIIADDFSKIYKSSDALEIGLYHDTEPLVNKTITIDINDVPYDRKTNDDGIAKLNINLDTGKYKTLIEFKGDDEYKSSKGHINVFVNPIIETSDLLMSEKDGSKFVATLKDNDGNVLQNVEVIFEVNGVPYTRKTNDKGQASLNINLNQGLYTIKTIKNDIVKENQISIQAPKAVEAPKQHFGYWVFGKDMLNVNLDNFKNNNVTDIFLNFYAFNIYGEAKVKDWINQTSNKGIKTHIWMQTFYDGEWHNPANTDMTSRIDEAKKYANISGVYGVHLDYLRYPGNAYKTNGGAEAITNFAKKIREAVPNIFLSCAVMPENEAKYYYGQDIEALGKIMDAILPMQYKGNYSAGTSWLASTTKNFSSKATIWSGLQSYKSDDDTTTLSINELTNDINTCLSNGAQGAILFRYGLAPNITFPAQTINTSKKATRMEGTDINMEYQDGTQYQCAVYDDNGRVTGGVKITVNGVSYNRASDATGLYKLDINLNPGTYSITAEYFGDDTHEASSTINTIVVKEKAQVETPKENTIECTNPYTSSPHPTTSGCNGMGQNTSTYCAPSSVHKCLYKFGIRDISQATLASWMGTNSSGTSHQGIATGIAKVNQVKGTNIKIQWCNKSDLTWEEIGKILCQPNKAIFCHILYKNGGTCSGSGNYGHYELLTKVNTDTGYVKVLNSLGGSCGSCYCGFYQDRTMACQETFINGISQKSICILTKQ